MPEETLTNEEALTEDQLNQALEQAEQEMDGSNKDGSQDGQDVMSFKDFLNQELGKNFKDDEAAIKAVRDTFNHVGKQREVAMKDAMENIDPDKFISRDEFDNAMFFAKNPEMEPYRETLTRLRGEGESLADVSASKAFKDLYEKAAAHDKAEQAKSILETNPRLGRANDKMSTAKKALGDATDALMKGDVTESFAKTDEATRNAVDAVLEAYEE